MSMTRKGFITTKLRDHPCPIKVMRKKANPFVLSQKRLQTKRFVLSSKISSLPALDKTRLPIRN